MGADGRTATRGTGVTSRELRGDIETIVRRALEKDKARRYQTAHALAADIRRFLNHEPIAARPPSTWYQLSRFSRRNRALVGGVAATFLALITGIIGTTRGLARAVAAESEQARLRQRADERSAEAMNQSRRANEARDLADQRTQEAQRVSQFQATMLRLISAESMGRGIKKRLRDQVMARAARAPENTDADPSDTNAAADVATFDRMLNSVQAADVARDTLDEDLLRPAALAIDGQFASHPLVQAELHESIGQSYLSLGLFEKAMHHLRRVQSLRDAEPEPNPRLQAIAVHNIAECLRQSGQRGAAVDLLNAAMCLLEERGLADAPEMGAVLNQLGAAEVEQDQCTSAVQHLLKAVALLHDADPPMPVTLVDAMNNLGLALQGIGGLAASEQWLRCAYDTIVESHDPRRDDMATRVRANLATVLIAQDKPDEAVQLCRQSLEALRAEVGDEHHDVAHAWSNLGVSLQRAGQLAEAEDALRRAQAGWESLGLTGHPGWSIAVRNLAFVLRARGDPDAAEGLVRAGLAAIGVAGHDSMPEARTMRLELSAILNAKGDSLAAQDIMLEVLAQARHSLGEDTPAYIDLLHALATRSYERGDWTVAEALYRAAVDGDARAGRDKGLSYGIMLCNLATALHQQGKTAEALPIMSNAIECEASEVGESHRELAIAFLNRAVLLHELKRMDEAERDVARATATFEKSRDREPIAYASCLLQMGHLLRARQDYEGMRRVLTRARGVLRKAGATGHPMYFIVRSGLGTALLELKRPKEAEPHLLGALKGLKKNRLAPPSGIQAMLDLIVRVYEQRHAAEPGQGFDSKAEEWRAKADKHRASTQPADPRDRAPAATQP